MDEGDKTAFFSPGPQYCTMHLPCSREYTSVLLLLVAAYVYAVIPCVFCDGNRPQIYRAENGTLHINSGVNETVLINGVDTVTRIQELEAELVDLKARANAGVFRGDLASCFLPQGVVEVTGNVVVDECNRMTNVDSFSTLRTVGGNLFIQSNGELENVDGFSSLTLVLGDLHINGNGMTNVDGFSSLTSVGGYLFINGHPNLANLNGFSRVVSVQGAYIRICYNQQLSAIPSFFSALSAGKSNPEHCLRTGHSCC